MKIPISKRLLCCAGMVRPGARVADVGCDHGYLGIYLLRQEIASFVAAMDLRPEPLEKARRNAARFGTEEKMFFAVCDGLSAVGPGFVDTVICAGMGGDTIAGILEDCPWAKDPEIHWILQPQSSGNDLRRWLGNHGYRILREVLIRDSGFLYSVLEVQYGGGTPVSPGRQYVSEPLLDNEPELVREYLRRVIRGIQRAVDGLARAKTEEESARRIYYEAALREVLEMEAAYENRTRD